MQRNNSLSEYFMDLIYVQRNICPSTLCYIKCSGIYSLNGYLCMDLKYRGITSLNENLGMEVTRNTFPLANAYATFIKNADGYILSTLL